MKPKKTARRIIQWIVLMAILPIFVIPGLLIYIIGQFTPSLNALIIKRLFEWKPFASPANIETIKKQVHVVKDVVYDKHGRENSLLDIYCPKHTGKDLPVIMWIHGGGFVSGNKEQTQEYGMALANEGYIVANINYALAPGEKYPQPVIQANKALEYLQAYISEYGGDMNRLFIGGDSAGAHIASQTAAVITNENLADSMGIQPSVDKKQLKGALLYCGLYNMDRMTRPQSSFILQFGVKSVFWSYTGVKNFGTFSRLDEMSTVNHITPDYPPVFLTVGDADPLAPHSADLIDVLLGNGVEADTVLFDGTNPELGHEYQFDFTSPHAEKTLGRTLEFLRRRS
ncbi:alpha/beta hydrolase [Paenibacillus dendritiformis]|uniref:alpha/beta hydrolase n=1 Tax=Paenibacillus dendritiformis TaxID=130049 RepID=UPI001F33E16C|nr:alpha/beta hydrolase [Paenibacillus dendritiformis]